MINLTHHISASQLIKTSLWLTAEDNCKVFLQIEIKYHIIIFRIFYNFFLLLVKHQILHKPLSTQSDNYLVEIWK